MIKSKLDKNIFLTFVPDEVGKTLHHIRNDPDVRCWCRQTGLIDERQQIGWLNAISADPKIRMYAICTIKPDSQQSSVHGICGLTDIDHLNQRAEFSIYVFPKDRRKGIAYKALVALFEHGFDDLNLNLIWGETFENNPAIKLFSKDIGMTAEGVRNDFYFKNGKFIDAHLFSIKRKDFKHEYG